METMERQLAGLSTLVHSALISKGMSETSQRDMEDLRKQILALHPDGSFIYHCYQQNYHLSLLSQLPLMALLLSKTTIVIIITNSIHYEVMIIMDLPLSLFQLSSLSLS